MFAALLKGDRLAGTERLTDQAICNLVVEYG